MDPTVPGYLREVEDVGWVQEIIAEIFDGALELMTPHSVVYGGAVRDCLAGIDLVGDLDIAVSQQEFSELAKRIQTSPKWLPADKMRAAMLSEDLPDEGTAKRPGSPSPSHPWAKKPVLRRNSGDLSRELAPMSQITSFICSSGREVQLMTSKQRTKDAFQDAIYMARMVDIICCSIVMTSDGRVFETIPGALDDCKNRVLRLNKSSDTLFIESLPSRVDKLVSRGWKNTIDVKAAMREIERKRDRDRRKQERRLLSSRHSRSISAEPETAVTESIEVHDIYGDLSKPAMSNDIGPSYKYSQKEVEVFFGKSRQAIMDSLNAYAADASVNIKVKLSPVGGIILRFNEIDELRRFRSGVKAPKPSGMSRKTSFGKNILKAYGSPSVKSKWAGFENGELLPKEAPVHEAPAEVKMPEPYSEPLPIYEDPGEVKMPEPIEAKSGFRPGPIKVTSRDKLRGMLPGKATRITTEMNSWGRFVKVALNYIDEDSGAEIELILELTEEEAMKLREAWQTLDNSQRKAFLEHLGNNARKGKARIM